MFRASLYTESQQLFCCNHPESPHERSNRLSYELMRKAKLAPLLLHQPKALQSHGDRLNFLPNEKKALMTLAEPNVCFTGSGSWQSDCSLSELEVSLLSSYADCQQLAAAHSSLPARHSKTGLTRDTRR